MKVVLSIQLFVINFSSLFAIVSRDEVANWKNRGIMLVGKHDDIRP